MTARDILAAFPPLGEGDDPEIGSKALRERLEAIRDNTYDLTRGGLGGGGLSLLPLRDRLARRGGS